MADEITAEYEVSTDPARMQIDVIHKTLAETYWSPHIRRDVVENAIRNSVVIGIFHQPSQSQVAFARLVTDFATFGWLCDVFVDPAHQAKGLAEQMVRRLLDDPRLVTLRRFCLATRDAHTLYQRFGFAPVPAERWMELQLPASNWQEMPDFA